MKIKWLQAAILISLIIFCGCNNAQITQKSAGTNAYLWRNKLLYPGTKLSLHEKKETIILKAKLKEQIVLYKDRKKTISKIIYNDITVIKGDWDYSELSFLIEVIMPRNPRLPRVWPLVRNDYLIFELKKVKNNYLIVGIFSLENYICPKVNSLDPK